MTSKPVPNEVTLSPHRPKRILGLISGYFFTRTRRSVVLIDCLGEIVLAVGFDQAMDFLKEMSKLCSRNNSSLIVQIAPRKLTEKQLAAIEKMVTPVR